EGKRPRTANTHSRAKDYWCYRLAREHRSRRGSSGESRAGMIGEYRQLLNGYPLRASVRRRQRPVEGHAAVAILAMTVERFVICGGGQRAVSHHRRVRSRAESHRSREFAGRIASEQRRKGRQPGVHEEIATLVFPHDSAWLDQTDSHDSNRPSHFNLRTKRLRR